MAERFLPKINNPYGDTPQSNEDYQLYLHERKLVSRLREAIGFCKDELQINHTFSRKLKNDEKINFEKCLTQNYLLKYGDDYFGKRDLIHLDLYAPSDIRKLNELS